MLLCCLASTPCLVAAPLHALALLLFFESKTHNASADQFSFYIYVLEKNRLPIQLDMSRYVRRALARVMRSSWRLHFS